MLKRKIIINVIEMKWNEIKSIIEKDDSIFRGKYVFNFISILKRE